MLSSEGHNSPGSLRRASNSTSTSQDTTNSNSNSNSTSTTPTRRINNPFARQLSPSVSVATYSYSPQQSPDNDTPSSLTRRSPTFHGNPAYHRTTSTSSQLTNSNQDWSNNTSTITAPSTITPAYTHSTASTSTRRTPVSQSQSQSQSQSPPLPPRTHHSQSTSQSQSHQPLRMSSTTTSPSSIPAPLFGDPFDLSFFDPLKNTPNSTVHPLPTVTRQSNQSSQVPHSQPPHHSPTGSQPPTPISYPAMSPSRAFPPPQRSSQSQNQDQNQPEPGPQRSNTMNTQTTGTKTVISPFEELIGRILEQELSSIVKAHKEALFLASAAKTAPQNTSQTVGPSGSSPKPGGGVDLGDEGRAFNAQFPPLPDDGDTHQPITTSSSSSPSPSTPPTQNPKTSPPRNSATQDDSFDSLVEQKTAMVVWRIKRAVEDKVSEGERSWRDERARAQEEYDRMESELDALERDSKGEVLRRAKLEQEVVKLQRSLEETTRQGRSHGEDLDAAVAENFELKEQVEILRAALNEVDEGLARKHHEEEEMGTASGSVGGASRGARGNKDVDAGEDDVWRELVDQQSEALSNHAQHLAKFSTLVSCPICSETLKGATTLSCGHSGCLECMQDWFSRGRRSCPECRVETAGTLAPAFALRELVDGLREMGMGEEET